MNLLKLLSVFIFLPNIVFAASQHSAEYFYIQTTKMQPVLLYENNKTKLTRTPKVICKIRGYVGLGSLGFSDIYSDPYTHLTIPNGNCKGKIGWVLSRKISSKKRLFVFKKSAFDPENVRVMPRYFKRVKQFRSTEPFTYSVKRFVTGGYSVTLRNKSQLIKFRLYNSITLGGYACGCVSFILKDYYPDYHYVGWDYVSKQWNKKKYVHKIRSYSKKGKLTGLEAGGAGVATWEFIIAKPKLLVKSLKKISIDDGNLELNDEKRGLVNVKTYYMNGKLMSESTLSSKEYWRYVFMPFTP